MQLSLAGRMRRLRTPGFVLLLSLTLVPSGCSIGRWFTKTPPPQSFPTADNLPPTSSTSSATGESSASPQWDFSQRQAEEKAAKTTPLTQQEAKATPAP